MNFWCQIAFIISLLATGTGAQASARMTMTGTAFGDNSSGISRTHELDGLPASYTRGLPASNSDAGVLQDVYSYDAANRLQSINSNGSYTGFSYDSQGNTTARGAQGYYFDQANRLLLVTGIASYSYDGLGRRLYSVGSKRWDYTDPLAHTEAALAICMT